MIFFRWFLLQNLIRSRAVEAYDYFIVTRSDYYYRHPHPRIVNRTDPSLIWIPEGEDYWGITDRHIVMPRMHVYAALSLMDPICDDLEELYNAMMNRREWNIEQYLKFHFGRRGILQYVRRFPLVMFTVRNPNTSVTWSPGDFNPEVGMIVKYPTEYDLSRESTPMLELP